MRRCLLVVALFAFGCGDNWSDDLFFTFDDRQVLCGSALDDINKSSVDWDKVQHGIDTAFKYDWIYERYAHGPGSTVKLETLERAFTMFDEAGLSWTTYRDLDPDAEPYPGITFAFDDSAIDSWFELRDMFARHHALVTFFVTRYDQFTPEQRAKLHTLADDGHDIEAHTMTHANAVEYAKQYGVDAYVQNEVLPSLEVLRADGFSPESFAYPYGARSDELDRAIEPYVRYIRTTPGPCPH
jgi:hypothetical protein